MTAPSHAHAHDIVVLRTKLYIPPPRPDLVRRSRLIERLNEGLDVQARNTARYGAHLLRYWEERGQAPDQPVTWRFSLENVQSGDDIDLWQPITRARFEALIATETHRIETCLLDTLERSGFAPEQLDAVVRTGGSAQIPCFVALLGRVFGSDKVVLSDVFSGVTAGLAIRAA